MLLEEELVCVCAGIARAACTVCLVCSNRDLVGTKGDWLDLGKRTTLLADIFTAHALHSAHANSHGEHLRRTIVCVSCAYILEATFAFLLRSGLCPRPPESISHPDSPLISKPCPRFGPEHAKVFTYPMEMYVARHMVDVSIFQTMLGKGPITPARHYGLTLVIWALSLILAVSTDNLGSILEIFGAFGASVSVRPCWRGLAGCSGVPSGLARFSWVSSSFGCVGVCSLIAPSGLVPDRRVVSAAVLSAILRRRVGALRFSTPTICPSSRVILK